MRIVILKIVWYFSSGYRNTMGELKLGRVVVNLADIIGQGSFGIVFSGRDDKTGKKVAIKKISIKNDDDICIAVEEIRNFDRLPVHPNLIRLLDFHYSDHAFWMVMDFCDKGDLDQYVCENIPTMNTKLQIMFQIACAIAHMHGASPPMIHRDIKPGNILLFRESTYPAYFILEIISEEN